MSNSKNKVMLIGHIGTLKTGSFPYEGGERKYCNLTLATNEFGGKKEDGQREEKTVWHSVSLFGGLAEIEKYGLKVGTKIHVEGRLEYNEQEGEREGVKVIYHNAVVIGERVLNLTPKEASAG